MAAVHIDLFSLAGGRSVRMEWPTDLNEAEASEIIPWLDIIERKIQRRMNENEQNAGDRQRRGRSRAESRRR